MLLGRNSLTQTFHSYAVRLRSSAVRTKASAWIGFTILILAATQVHPGLASLLTIAMIAPLLILMRWLAHIEGRWGG